MPKTFYNILFELLEIFEVVNNKAEKRRNFQKPILKKVIVNRKVLEEHPKKFGTLFINSNKLPIKFILLKD